MKILIAMSGGVDSSVAAGLLCRDGNECIGATMKLYHNEDAGIPPHNLQTPKNDLSVFGFRKFDLRRLFGQLIKPNKLNKLKNRKPMKQISFLAFDLGATSGRTILGTLNEGKLQMKELTRFPNQILELNGHAYWNIFSLYEHLKAGMIAAAKAGTLCVDKLEAMTCVCSVGLDMIAVPGDTPAETISAIIADEAAIGMVNNKTTAVRLLPTPGKNVGDTVEMGGLLGSAPVMPVHEASSADFIARGGRIPAPLQSLKN